MKLRVAFVHDWLTGMRGGEYVLEALIELFPHAELFTLLAVPGSVSPAISALPLHTSPLQKVPQIGARYRYFLPLMPWAVEQLELKSFDLVISSSHCVAKGIRKPAEAVHISYVHAPMRYIWDRYSDYFGPGRARLMVRAAAALFRMRLQNWDRRTSQSDRVNALVANSRFIAHQIEAAYGRKADVVYPFADLKRFSIQGRAAKRSSEYLMVTAFAPNKRVDLAIEAFNQLKLPLNIVGGGQERKQLESKAGPTIRFLGALSNAEIAEQYLSCRAFVFPGVDDFGITPVEAMASGAPVIAFAAGGALETVTSETGVFFEPQTVEALIEAVQKVESGLPGVTPEKCRARAEKFSKELFKSEFLKIVTREWIKSGKDPAQLS